MVRVDGLLQHAELHRVERIDPSAAPVGPGPHPAFLGVALPEQLATRRGDDGEPVEQPIHQRELRVPRDLGEQRVGVEARVGGGGEQEADVLLRRGLVRRGGGDDRRRLVRPRAIAGGVAGGAVDADARKADRHLREADRQLATVLRQEAEGGIPARRRQQIGKDPRQHQPDPVRDAFGRLGPDRSEQEVIFGRGEVGRRLLAEEALVDQRSPTPCPGRRAARTRGGARSGPDDPVHQALDAAGFAASDPEAPLTATSSRSSSGTRNTRSKSPSMR